LSAITKLFVVLHVIMSMLLTAGLVVFVNRVEAFSQANQRFVEDLKVERGLRSNLESTVAQLESDKQSIRQVYEGRLAVSRGQIEERDATVSQLQGEIAKQDQTIRIQVAANETANEAVQVATATQQTLEGQLAAIRADAAETEQQLLEATTELADSRSVVAVMKRQLRQALEEVEYLNGELQRASLEQDQQGPQGGRVATTRGDRGGAGPAPVATTPITGEIRDRRTIGGVEYATISIGSKDNVSEGMQFYVVDRDRGEYLGKLIVDAVEDEEASGRLQGRNIDQVRQGHEVRTQLSES